MIGSHKARTQIALVLSVFLLGCEDKAAKAAQDKMDCLDARLRFRAVVDAMCTPWNERRERVISRLVEEVQEDKIADPNSDPSEEISDIASGVTAKDCVRAGYADPGEKIVDPKRRRSLPPEVAVDAAKAREWLRSLPAKGRVETRAACDLWGDQAARDLTVKGSTPAH